MHRWPLVFALALVASCGSSPAESADASINPDARTAAPRDASAIDALPEMRDAGRAVYVDLPTSPPTRTCGPEETFPRITGRPITVGGQPGFFHDEGHGYGYFNTFDALVACPGATPRKTHVFLPRDYATSGRDYPVLYVNDGQTAFFTDNDIGRTWDLAGVLTELARCGEIEDVIVVAPHEIDRSAEYGHLPSVPGESCCQADAYATYLESCLGGFIESQYRVRRGRENTAIMGSSRGGLGAFWFATRTPVRFGHVAAVSSSFWVGIDDRTTGAVSDAALQESALWAHAAPVILNPAARPAMWIDWGLVRTGGDHNAIVESLATVRGREMVALIESQTGLTHTGFAPGSPLVAIEDVDGDHTEDTWNVRVRWILRWMFPAR